MSGDGARSNGDRSVDDRGAAAGLAEFLRTPTSYPNDERRLIYAKGENTRHIRHAQILERWPVLAEDGPGASSGRGSRPSTAPRGPPPSGGSLSPPAGVAESVDAEDLDSSALRASGFESRLRHSACINHVAARHSRISN